MKKRVGSNYQPGNSFCNSLFGRKKKAVYSEFYSRTLKKIPAIIPQKRLLYSTSIYLICNRELSH